MERMSGTELTVLGLIDVGSALASLLPVVLLLRFLPAVATLVAAGSLVVSGERGERVLREEME